METTQVHNEILNKYNQLNSIADLMKSKNAHLSKILKVAEATLSLQKAELNQVEQQAKYYKDKSSSIKMYTMVKVRVEMLKEYTKGKTSSWDPEVAFKAWEKMNTLYSEFEGEDELQEVGSVEPNGTSGKEPSRQKDGTSRSRVVEENFVVEHVE